MRLLGIDYGTRRTGVALADTETRLAAPFELFTGLTDRVLADRLCQLIRQENIGRIACGLPLNMDGTAGPQAARTEAFIRQLELRSGRDVQRVDERLSSAAAEWKLAGHFTRRQKRRRVDAVAAARILQDFLDHGG